MRTFIENYLHFMKNCIRPHYEKLKPLKSGFIENTNFENNRDPCSDYILTIFWVVITGVFIRSFWSIVLDDHWSKKIFRPLTIADMITGAKFTSDDLVNFALIFIVFITSLVTFALKQGHSDERSRRQASFGSTLNQQLTLICSSQLCFEAWS